MPPNIPLYRGRYGGGNNVDNSPGSFKTPQDNVMLYCTLKKEQQNQGIPPSYQAANLSPGMHQKQVI